MKSEKNKKPSDEEDGENRVMNIMDKTNYRRRWRRQSREGGEDIVIQKMKKAEIEEGGEKRVKKKMKIEKIELSRILKRQSDDKDGEDITTMKNGENRVKKKIKKTE